MKPRFFWACLMAGIWSCSVKTPPPTSDVVTDALPPTTEIPSGWSAPTDDTGQVDDGWIQSFGEPELEALVDEAVQSLRRGLPGAALEACGPDQLEANDK